MELASESSKPPKKLRTKRWWLWYGTLAWGIPFFVAMTILDRKTHTAGLLAFSFAISILGGCYWGFRMWKFYESKRK